MEQFIEAGNTRIIGSMDFFIRRLAYLSMFGKEHGGVDNFLGFLQCCERTSINVCDRVPHAIPMELLTLIATRRSGSLLSKYLSHRFDSALIVGDEDAEAFSMHLENFFSKFPELKATPPPLSLSFTQTSTAGFLPPISEHVHHSLPNVLFGDKFELSSLFVKVIKKDNGLFLLNAVVDSIFASNFGVGNISAFTIQLLNDHIFEPSKLGPHLLHLEMSFLKRISGREKGTLAMLIQKEYLTDSSSSDAERPQLFVNLFGKTLFRLYESSWPYFSNIGNEASEEPYYFKQLLIAYLGSEKLFPDPFSKCLFVWKVLLRSPSFYSCQRASCLLVESILVHHAALDEDEKISIFPNAALSLIGSLPTYKRLYDFLQVAQGLKQSSKEDADYVGFVLDLYHIFVESYKKLPFTASVFINFPHIDQSFIPFTFGLVSNLNAAQMDKVFSKVHRIELFAYLLLIAAKNMNAALLRPFFALLTSPTSAKWMQQLANVSFVEPYFRSLEELIVFSEKNKRYFQKNSMRMENLFLILAKELPFINAESFRLLSSHICKQFDTVGDLRMAHGSIRTKYSILSFVREEILPKEHRGTFDLIAPIFKAMISYPSSWPVNATSHLDNFRISII